MIPRFCSLIVFILLAGYSIQQTCTSNLYGESETSIPMSGICPIGFVNYMTKCYSYSQVLRSKNSAMCYKDVDCLFSYMRCINQKCYPGYRFSGDFCEIDNQCLQDETPSGNVMADILGTKCIQNKCSKYNVVERNQGESCYVDEAAKTVYGCQKGYTCYKCCNGGQISKCLPIVYLGKGEKCGNLASDNVATRFELCRSGLQCRETATGNNQWVCKDRIPKDGVCTTTGTDLCDNGLVCRQKSPIDNKFTCQTIPSYGDSCVMDSDCAFFKSGLVKCIGYKCARIYGAALGANCKENEECYSSYCATDGKCAKKEILDTCTSTFPCVSGSCSCSGKQYSSNPGKCTTPCNGPATDVKACLYNVGVDITGSNQFLGLDKYQFADQRSSLFLKCKVAYSRYYSCMRMSLEKTGIFSSGGLEGIDWNAYSEGASPFLPERSQGVINSLPFGWFIPLITIFYLLF